ncbi:MAG: type II secretion system protein N [Hyphomonadaceae bacterium]
MKFRLWHIVVFVIALAAFAAARAPIGAFVKERPGLFTYGSASGTVWSGRFTDVALGPYQARTMTWRLSLLELVQSRMYADITFDEGTIRGAVRLLGNLRGDRRLITHDLVVQGVPLGDSGIMLPGDTTLRGVDILFEEGRCTQAAASVHSDVLQRSSESLSWRGPILRGDARCEGDAALVDLAGVTRQDERVAALLDLRPDGSGGWRAMVRTEDPQGRAALAAAGFQVDAAEGGLVRTGELRWFPY